MIANTEGCVGLEDIAALAEGRLSGEERERVVGHVAACAECREVLAGVVVELGEAGALSTGSGVPLPIDRSPSRRLGGGRSWSLAWAALAAGVLMVTGAMTYHRFVYPQLPDRREWLASMPPAEQLVPSLWGGAVMRGGAEQAELERQSARLGALLVDLEVLLATDDEALTAEVLARIAEILDSAGLLDAEADALRQLAQTRPLPSNDELRLAVKTAEPVVRKRFDTAYLDLGAFAEQTRLEATIGVPTAFTTAERRYVRQLLASEGALPGGARSALTALADDDLSASDRKQAAGELLRSLTL